MERETQSFWTHLEEFRTVLLRIGLVLFVGIALSFLFASSIFHLLLHPYADVLAVADASQSVLLQTLAPSETFKLSFEIALICGIICTSPYSIYHLWSFISPGLTPREKKVITPLFLIGVGLFAMGAIFAYFTVLPLSLNFFWSYSLNLGIQPMWRVGEYLSFVMTTLLSFGLAFELPVIIAALTFLDVVSPQMLAKGRKAAIFIIFLVAAFLTPPDIISQLLMGLPLYGLFELSILISRLISKRRLPSPMN